MKRAEQQALPGMDLGRVTFVSPSSLERYRHCPRLYRFLHVDGLWRLSRSSPQQAFGTSVHAALREFYRLPVGRRSLRTLLELFRRLWVRDGYRGKEEQQRERERGVQALRAWYQRADTAVVPHATELGLQAAYGEIVVKGRLDRVDAAADGGLVVVDYKTGRGAATPTRR
jgi:putative RecB family exonuclease